MISYNNAAPKAVNNVGQFGATEGSIGAYKSAAEYAADAKYWALLSQTKYTSVEDIIAEVERLYAQGYLLESDIRRLRDDFEAQNQVLLGLIQSTGTAIDNANAATELSKEATQEVLAQLDIISNMSVQTALLPPGSLATGSYDNTTGVFSFGIPEGQPGRDGTDGTISDIGSVAIGTPVSDDYGFYIDKEDGGLYRTSMVEIANLVPSVRSISINGGEEQIGSVSFNSVSSFNARTGDVLPVSGDYSVDQITGAAASGINSDITSLTGLTTAISVGQGGTGASTPEEARTNLELGSVSVENIVPVLKGGTGASTAEGARTSLGLGLVATESIVPITKGGTGSTSSENARLALVSAKSGDNYDITSLNNLTTALSVIQGGTGADTPDAAWLNIRPTGSTPLNEDPINPLDAATKRWTENKLSDLALQEVARAANVKDSEVILSTDTTKFLNDKKVIFSVSEQKSYGLPVLPTNVYISSVSNGQLTYQPGNITVSLLPVPTELRQELVEDTGASVIGTTGGSSVQERFDALSGFDINQGDALLPVVQPYPGSVHRTQHDKNAEQLTVADWGAVSGVESSAAAQAMVDETRTLIVPVGFNLVAKNINISDAKEVFIYGKMSLPDGCVDFDRALYADGNNNGIQIFINEIDGNRAGQSGQIGTHLLYMTNCEKVNAYVKYAHDNYFSRTYTSIAVPDGKRSESAGCLYFHQCNYSQCIVDLIERWGREGIYAFDSTRFVMALGHAQGRIDSIGDEYSGFQISGTENRLLYASVDRSGASGGSFDCLRSWAGPIIVSNNRYFGSVGMGHPGAPATDSVIESITSINSSGNGVQMVGGSSGNRILSATIINPATNGIQQSDGAKDNIVNNFVVRDPGASHVTSFANTLILTNGDLTANAKGVAKLNTTGGGNFTLRNVRLDPAKQLQLTGINGLAGNSTVTITDGNITPYSHIVLFPSNANGALANVYISTINMGSCVLNTASGTPAGSGASLRYMVL